MMKTLFRHERAIDIMAQILADHACLIDARVTTCSKLGCNEQATVRHVDIDVKMCDVHAAESIVYARKNIKADLNDPFNLVRTRLADEECWVDDAEAVRIRRLKDYVEIIREGTPSDAPQVH